MLNVNIISFRESFNFIESTPENSIIKLNLETQKHLFNKAIQYLSNNTGKIARNRPLIYKFIRLIPEECAQHPALHKILGFLRDSDSFYQKSLWTPFSCEKKIDSNLEKILENHVLTGNEAMAIEMLEHGFPCSLHLLFMACELGRDQVIAAIVNMNLFIKSMYKTIIVDSSEKIMLALLQNGFEFSIDALIVAHKKGYEDFLTTVSKKGIWSKELLNSFITLNEEELALAFLDYGFPFSTKTLHLACIFNLPLLAAHLIVKGIDVLEVLKIKDQNGRTLMHLAVLKKQEEFISISAQRLDFNEFKNQLNVIDFFGCSALDYAVKSNDAELNKLIIDIAPELSVDLETKVMKLIQSDIQNFKIYRKILKTAVPNSNILPQFKTVEEVGKDDPVFLLGKSIECLKESLNLISAYTAKIDSSITIDSPQIDKVDEENLKKGFTHRVAIHQMLPPTVREIYGSASFRKERNCHGAAMVTSGIKLHLNYCDSPLFAEGFKENTYKVPLKEIKLGDWVYLEEGPPGALLEGANGAHSFVYLSKDLCLSMNGYGQKLKFYKTQDVLNAYGFPSTALESSLDGQENPWKGKYISIFRINEHLV